MTGLSIIVTYYKGRNFITNCIDSLLSSYAASDQKLEYEIIVIIDSMDDSIDAQKLLTERYLNGNVIVSINEKNIGVSNSRNRGLKMISKNYYTIIDQDDYVKLDYFSVLEKELDIQTPVHIINGAINYVNDSIEVPIYTFEPKFEFKNLILKKTFIYTPGLLIFNSKFIPSAGLFIDTSETYKGCDDWAAYLNIILSTKDKIQYKFINKILFVYCLHSTNYSNNKEEMIMSSVAVLDYLKEKKQLKDNYLSLIIKARKMQTFYLARDVEGLSLPALLFTHPNQFLYQYLFSLFSLDNANKIIIKLKHKFGKIAGNKNLNI